MRSNPDGRNSNMQIVIVDDNPTNIALVQAVAKTIAGAQAKSFLDPQQALAWCEGNALDLLIVDYMMPGINGIDFISRLRGHPGRGDVPMLMVTANPDRKVLYKALEAGATDFLHKPLDIAELGARVRNMLAIRKSHLSLAGRADELAREVAKATAAILARERETIARLARAAEFRDPETGAHIVRMAHISRLVALQLTGDEDYAQRIFEAAPMHDVGKLGTPDHILLKPGKLTPDEFTIMKRHASIGWSILKDSASPILQFAAEIAHAHHEKYDGSGYPGGLRGDDIPLCGRIVAVADVFDALTSARPYKPAWDKARAIAFLAEGSGSHFDPACVAAFMERLEEVLEICERYADEEEVQLA
jgi:putative two-component system response regulator